VRIRSPGRSGNDQKAWCQAKGAFSLKANPNLAVCQLMASQREAGAGGGHRQEMIFDPRTAELLGGRDGATVPLYRSVVQGLPQAMAECAARYVHDGYRRLQVKVGLDPHDDVERMEAVLDVVPAGTVIHIISWHDNSSANRANPDPGLAVQIRRRRRRIIARRFGPGV